MRYLKKVIISFLLCLSFLFLSPEKIFAVDCQVASWDPNTRNLQTCVGQFNSPTELKSTTANFNCLGNSNAPNASICRDITNPTYSLSGTPDDQIAQDAQGKYYTCITGQGLNRAIGKIEVQFLDASGKNLCSTESIITKPSDWDPLTEGLPWQTGSTGGGGGGAELECIVNGTPGINTALGCISFDVAGGGLVNSILGLAIGLGGAAALVLMLYGFYVLTTSAGIPDKVKAGQEIITSAVGGLLFIIFAVVLMNLIGVKILQIPGL